MSKKKLDSAATPAASPSGGNEGGGWIDDVGFAVSEPYRTLLRTQAEISLRWHRRASIGFGAFAALLLAVAVAAAIATATRKVSCDDFSPSDKALIAQALQPSFAPNTWTEIHLDRSALSPPPRLAHAATAVAERYIYIFGGTYGSPTIPDISYGDLYVYDEHLDTWTNVTQSGDVPPPRLHATLVTKDDDTMLLFGGFNVFFRPGVASHTSFSDLYSFTISTGRWTNLTAVAAANGPSPTKRGAHGAEWLNGAMYVYGGFPVIAQVGHIKELWKFEWATMAWTNVTMPLASPEGRIGFAFLAIDSATLLVMGGACSSNVDADGQCDVSWTYTPATNVWVPLLQVTGTQPKQRRASDAAAAVAGIVYQFGGVFINNSVVPSQPEMFKDLYAFDVVNAHWMQLFPDYNRGQQPPACFGHSLTRVGNRVVLFGGRVGNGASPGSSQLWEYTAITPL